MIEPTKENSNIVTGNGLCLGFCPSIYYILNRDLQSDEKRIRCLSENQRKSVIIAHYVPGEEYLRIVQVHADIPKTQHSKVLPKREHFTESVWILFLLLLSFFFGAGIEPRALCV
jgi:hypothetical protein